MIVGTHGRTGVGKLLLGSKAEEILRQAPCPVLTVGPKVSGRAKLPALAAEAKEIAPVEIAVRQIVYATDFSPESLAAALFATSLAQEFQAKLTLLHVIEKFTDKDRRPKPLELMLQGWRNWCRRKLGCGARPGPQSNSARPRSAYSRKLWTSRADLIVLGVRAGSRPPRRRHASAMDNRSQGHCQRPLPGADRSIRGGPPTERRTRWILRVWRGGSMKQLKASKQNQARNEGYTQAELAAEVRRRAFELYEQQGRVDGHALEHGASRGRDLAREAASGSGLRRPVRIGDCISA